MIVPFLLVLILCAPSIVSYTPYETAWDDTYFLHRAACFHDAVYNLDLAGMARCYSIVTKSPILTFMTLPWGRAASGEAAVPLALIALAILIWILVLLTYRVAIAGGAAPWVLPVAALAVWLNPFIRSYGGSFLSDILVAWCTLLLLLLLPLELRTEPGSPRLDIARGALWGLVILVGTLSKATFVFFLGLTGLALIWIRSRRLGGRSCIRASVSAVICSLPAVGIWALCWRNFLGHAVGSSFGAASKAYATAGMTAAVYLREYIVTCSWGCLPTAALVPYYAWRLRRSDKQWLRMLPLALILIYLALCALSPNTDYRFAMPVMIALPFVLAVVPSSGIKEAPPSRGLLGWALLGCVLCSVPMLARPEMKYVRYAGAVLDSIGGPNAKIMLASESPHLNIETFLLANELRKRRVDTVTIDTLVYDSVNGRSIDDSFHRMESADYILCHKPPLSTEPKWANQFANEFYRHATEIADEVEAPSEYMHVLKVRPPDSWGTGSAVHPHLAAISTSPSPPPSGTFHWTITGTGFTPGSRVVVTGLGCESGCNVSPAGVSFKGSTELSGVADLTHGSGSYQFQILNGKLASNALTIEIKR